MAGSEQHPDATGLARTVHTGWIATRSHHQPPAACIQVPGHSRAAWAGAPRRVRRAAGLVAALVTAVTLLLVGALPASAGTLTSRSGVASNTLFASPAKAVCSSHQSLYDPSTVDRNILAIPSLLYFTENGPMDEMYAQVRLDRWNGTKWVLGYGWGPVVKSTFLPRGYNWYFQFPTAEWHYQSPSYFSVQIHYWFYRNGQKVGEAWEAPTQADYGLDLDGIAPEAWVATTGPSQPGYCALP